MTPSKITRRSMLAGMSAAGAGLALAGPLPFSLRSAVAQTDPSSLSGQVVVSINGEVPQEAQEALSAAYRQARPNVEVIWELPGVSGEGYTTWLGTQVAAGNIRPDVVSGNYFNNFRNYFNFDLVRSSVNPHTGHAWEQDLDWDFFAPRDSQGKRTVLATRGVHTMWYYNQDLFDKAGVQPPTNWSEFVDVCAKLEEAGITPIGANYSLVVTWWLSTYYFDQFHVDWVETIRAQPGDWNYNPSLDDAFVYDPSDPFIHNNYTFNQQRFWRGLRDGTLRYDTPSLAEMVRNYAQVFPRYANKDLFVAEDYYPTFLQGEAAMMFNTTSSLVTLNHDVPALPKPFNWGYFNPAPMEGPEVKGPIRSSESAIGEYVSIIEKDQAQTDLTLDFVMFWLSAAGYQPFLDGEIASGAFSPGGPLKIAGVQDPPEVQELFEGVTFIGSAAKFQNWFVAPGAGDDSPVKQDSFNLFQEALEGKHTPEDYAAKLQALVMDNFDALLEYVGLTQDDLDNPARQPGT